MRLQPTRARPQSITESSEEPRTLFLTSLEIPVHILHHQSADTISWIPRLQICGTIGLFWKRASGHDGGRCE